jgi:hypothetical protein
MNQAFGAICWSRFSIAVWRGLFHVALFIHAEALYVDFVADFDDVL